MSERVCGLGRGPWQHKRVGFGVSQAARSASFQPNNWVLRQEMRWPFVFVVFSPTAYGYGKGGQRCE